MGQRSESYNFSIRRAFCRKLQQALDDADFELGALYENKALLAEVRKGRSDWSLLDVHSGLYMLGTRRKMGLSFLSSFVVSLAMNA